VLQTPPTAIPTLQLVRDVVALTVPLLLVAAVASAAIGLLQTGGIFVGRAITPDLARTNPGTGLGQIVSWPRVFAALRALLGVLLVGGIAIGVMANQGAPLAATVGDTSAAAQLAATLAERLAWTAALVALALGVADLAVTRTLWLRRLRMSRAEIRDELRQTEGDLALRSARRRLHQRLAATAALQDVRRACLVVTGRGRQATALRFNPTQDLAPYVVAQGAGELGAKLQDAARVYDVPLVTQPPLARALGLLDVGQPIPRTLYEPVAELLREVQGSTGRRTAT
jgi:flagellar biosynthetic protein FlhB